MKVVEAVNEHKHNKTKTTQKIHEKVMYKKKLIYEKTQKELLDAEKIKFPFINIKLEVAVSLSKFYELFFPYMETLTPLMFALFYIEAICVNKV